MLPKLSKYMTALGTYNVKSFTYEINQQMHTRTHTHIWAQYEIHTEENTYKKQEWKVRNFVESDEFSKPVYMMSENQNGGDCMVDLSR